MYINIYIYRYIGIDIDICHESYKDFFARQLLCISYFDCVMNATAQLYEWCHKYVCDAVIRCKIQEKNYCKLQFI